MLGKLIKNEIINRFKSLVWIYLAVLVAGPVMHLVDILEDHVTNSYVRFFCNLVMVIYGLLMIAAIVVVLISPMMDYRARVFKDQGYLTNTLPVKTGSMIGARMICDLLVYISAAVVFPIAMCLAAWNFELFDALAEFLSEMFRMFGQDVRAAQILAIGGLSIILVFASALMFIWTFNAAYAIGHSFSNHRKLLSVISYIVLYYIQQMIAVGFVFILSKSGIVDQMFGNVEIAGFRDGIIFMVLVTIFELLGVLLMGFISGWTIKNKLNLE